MAILIPDMEMPIACDDCFFTECIFNLTGSGMKQENGKSELCPLIEVKTPKAPMSDADLEACNFEL